MGCSQILTIGGSGFNQIASKHTLKQKSLIWKEGNVFNNTLNTFIYGYMASNIW